MCLIINKISTQTMLKSKSKTFNLYKAFRFNTFSLDRQYYIGSVFMDTRVNLTKNIYKSNYKGLYPKFSGEVHRGIHVYRGSDIMSIWRDYGMSHNTIVVKVFGDKEDLIAASPTEAAFTKIYIPDSSLKQLKDFLEQRTKLFKESRF